MDYFLPAILPVVRKIPGPMQIPWPGTPTGILTVENFDEWQKLVLDLGLHPAIPRIIADGYVSAQKLYLLGWLDGSMIKAGDLVVLATLEAALRDRYGHHFRRTPKQVEAGWTPGLSLLINYMLKHDDLTDEKLPMIKRYGGSVIGVLDGTRVPSLVDIRNDHVHGFPFSPHWAGGTLHLAHDLMLYAYRHFIAEAVS